MSKCLRFLNNTCDLAKQKLTFYSSAHLFPLMLRRCCINGLWNQFKPEAFMSCKLNLIGLNFFHITAACTNERFLLFYTKGLYGVHVSHHVREGRVGGFDV